MSFDHCQNTQDRRLLFVTVLSLVEPLRLDWWQNSAVDLKISRLRRKGGVHAKGQS
jgi:hypothetical protein